MKKLLLVCAGLLGLCSLGQTTVKADDWGYHRDSDDYRPRRPVYHERSERCDDGRDSYRTERRVVVREYYTPTYYTDDCQPRYYHRRHHSRVGLYLPLPPLPF